MKHIDKKTEQKLYWLFIPMALVVVTLILDLWFGVDLNFLAWYKPALIGSVLIVFTGYSIAAIKQKCWGYLAFLLLLLSVLLLNMSNVLINLFFDPNQ